MPYQICSEKQKNTWDVPTFYSEKQTNLNWVLVERNILEENSNLFSLFPVCVSPEKFQSNLVKTLLLSLPSTPSSNSLGYTHGSHVSEYHYHPAPASIPEGNGT